jgi:hypothetical protein
MGPKAWIAAAPVSRMFSLVALGGPVAPWVVWEVMIVLVDCKTLVKELGTWVSR